MNHKKNIGYIIAVLIFAVSVAAFFVIYENISAKEGRINGEISSNLSRISGVQNAISKNIESLNKLEIPLLRYGYSFNENDEFFISDFSGAARRFGIRPKEVKLVSSNKKKYSVSYLFKVAGYGERKNIYLFINYIEEKDKAILKKFKLYMPDGKNLPYSFYSEISVNAIKKSEVIPPISKLVPAGPAESGSFGPVNPFAAIPAEKAPVRKSAGVKVTRNQRKEPVFGKAGTSGIPRSHSGAPGHYTAKEINPAQSEVYNKEGVTFFNKKMYGKAYEMFDNAARLNPSNYMALSNAALACYKLKNYGKSIYFGKNALKMKNIWQINFILGVDYLKSGRNSEASAYFKRALKLHPGDKTIAEYLKIADNNL